MDDDRARRRGRMTRLLAAGTISAAIAGSLAATGAVSYATTAFGKPGKSAASDEYRPGWGCGDKNHKHTGPPGHQYASPPPGCTR